MIPPNGPERREMLDDNARKFIIDSLPSEFLDEIDDKSFVLTTDWLEMGEDSEKKLACKQYKNGKIEYLLIQKFTDEDGNRAVPPKEKLTEEKYNELVQLSVLRVKKTRFEFTFVQNDISFEMKYDEFFDSDLRILEVDAESEDERKAFDPNLTAFPVDLREVTGDKRYYGYRVAEML